MAQGSEMVERLLDAAERMCRSRGYNGFSYRDLADAVGIKTASIHYHFPTKGDLGRAMMVRYRQTFESARLAVERQEPTGLGRVRRLLDVLQSNYKAADSICLAGILVAEAGAIPPELHDEVRRFFIENEAWLTATLELGVRQGNVTLREPAEAAARSAFALIEGGIFAARAFADPKRLTTAAASILHMISP